MFKDSKHAGPIEKRLQRLTQRVEILERDSHPPIDLTPAIIDVLDYLGYPLKTKVPSESPDTNVSDQAKLADNVEGPARAISKIVNPWDTNGDEWEGYVDEARAAISAMSSRNARLREAICASTFVTSVSEGSPDSAKRKYRIEMRYASMDDLHRAQDAISDTRRNAALGEGGDRA